ncbi:MAG: APC family permease [Myxococcales bacterium]
MAQSLKSGTLGLVGAATLGVVMLSPAMTLYANFGAAYATAGSAAPLAFVWALLATLPTAASYALLSRERPEAGSAASWTAAFSTRAARWVGWMVFLYYLTNFVLQPVTLGLFFNDLLTAFGLHAGVGTYAIGAFLCCALPALIAYRGIHPSSEGALGFLVFEAVVVTALCVAVARAAPALNLDGFRSAPGPGMFQAMIFAMLSYCGFDVISTVAEEAKMPRTLIPQATFLALGVFGALIIGGVWSLTFAAEPARLKAMVDETNGMPITAVARGIWGRGSLLVMLTGISAALGIAIATAVGASRVLFSMARSGLAPRVFERLRRQVPANAMHLIFASGLLGAVVVGALAGPYRAYLWWGSTATFFAMITFVFVNLANLVLHRERTFRSVPGFFLYGALPLSGIAVDLFILWRSFVVEQWGQGVLGRSAIAFDVACAVVALFALLKRDEPAMAAA